MVMTIRVSDVGPVICEIGSAYSALILQVGGATGRIGDPSGHTIDRPELQSAVVKSNVRSIKENIQHIFSNHEQYLWDKHSSTRTLTPAMYVNGGFQVNGKLEEKIMYCSIDMFEFF